LSLFLSSVQAGEPVSKSFFGGVAIDGHDTVAYHKIGEADPHKASRGEKSWSAEWKGATWLFTTEADRDLFAAEPERYAPAYNGHCANALSLGEGLVKTDGTHWQIFEDQLYTFYAARGRDRWLDGNFKQYKLAADRAWQEFISE
jgi:YHS domain-containing protein